MAEMLSQRGFLSRHHGGGPIVEISITFFSWSSSANLVVSANMEKNIQQGIKSTVYYSHLNCTTVYIGFYDQPPSQKSGSLNPVVVAKLSGCSLGLATRWSLKPM